jgi:hypothetical protein
MVPVQGHDWFAHLVARRDRGKKVQVQATRSFATSENLDIVMAEQELVTMRA